MPFAYSGRRVNSLMMDIRNLIYSDRIGGTAQILRVMHQADSLTKDKKKMGGADCTCTVVKVNDDAAAPKIPATYLDRNIAQ